MSERNLLRLFPELAGATVGGDRGHVGVLRVRPGADLVGSGPTLQAALPADVLVLTRPEFIAKERDSGTRSRRSAPSSTSAW